MAMVTELQAFEAAETPNQQRARAQLERQKAEIALARAHELRARIENGERISFFESIYLAVDSQIMNESVSSEFSIGPLRLMGLEGWDVVAVIPRTIGTALTNTSSGSTFGESWGAGMGGNVAGVHVVLKKEISTHNNVSDEFLQSYVARNLDDLFAGR